ncbi:MAG: phospholipase D family protein [Chloroflexi bacterium]|nr:phospholipase D family protein [Chloroflexota bacterium]
MNDAELFGGVLYSASDVAAAARTLAHLLKSSQTDVGIAAEAGLDPLLVDSLRNLNLADAHKIDHASALGAAWVLGRRSASIEHSWEAVASIPSNMELPEGLERITAETLIGLANHAAKKLRLAAPYMDVQGLGYLMDSLVAATLRRVDVEIVRSVSGQREEDALTALLESVHANGDIGFLTVLEPLVGVPFPHLKVMTVDGKTAYVGSANLTAAALEARNLELGVLVVGEQVQILDGFLDSYVVPE